MGTLHCFERPLGGFQLLAQPVQHTLSAAAVRLVGPFPFRHRRPAVQYLQRIAQGILRHLAKLPLDVRQDQPEHGEVFLAQLQLFPDQGRRLFRRVSLAQLLIIFGLDVQWKISAVQ